MDVVNGKIVSARTERSRSDIWSALKPSRGVLEGPCPHGEPAHHAPGSLRVFYGSPVHRAAAFQPGWHRSSSISTPSWGRERVQHKCSSRSRSGSGCAPSKCFSRASFDKEMDMYESQVSQAVIGRFTSLRSVGTAETTSPATCLTASPATADEQPRHGAAAASPLKRPRVEPHSGIDQVDGPWIAPLRYLLRKVMSVSDVGELGRIVLPKRDAEGQLPQIDTKGKQLEMKDYSFSKSWFFHYKWWVNNKSRMYVLENTGDFIKYHGLQANDSFFVYEDGCGNLVARGQKKLTWVPLLDSTVHNSKSGFSDVKDSESENLPTSTEDESCCMNSTVPHSASALDERILIQLQGPKHLSYL